MIKDILNFHLFYDIIFAKNLLISFDDKEFELSISFTSVILISIKKKNLGSNFYIYLIIINFCFTQTNND